MPEPILIVALGASNTYGEGVERGASYPAQLEGLLRAAGHDVRVVNAGIYGNKTGQMLARLDADVPAGTHLVILQPSGNDRRAEAERTANIAEIEHRLAARGVKMILLERSVYKDLPRQADGMHLTPEGYRALAGAMLPVVLEVLEGAGT
jgi:acyl-CoA thioesterase I